MKFLVDAQLPPALARWIASQGHHAVHVFDLELHTADDPAVWRCAEADDSIIVTKDENFVDRWLLSNEPVRLAGSEKGTAQRGLCWSGYAALPKRSSDWNNGRN